jgi:hypothetical protein
MSAFFISHPVRASTIRKEPVTVVVEGDAASLAQLAALYGLPAIRKLRGVFELRHLRGGIVAARLALQAAVTQVCVITLEPFDAEVIEDSVLHFIPAASVPEGAEAELAAEALEGPDEIPYANDTIDLGAALAEQLALALDPYPRKPGAVLPAAAAAGPQNPFSLLAKRGDGGEKT